jgi:hypothetical protein
MTDNLWLASAADHGWIRSRHEREIDAEGSPAPRSLTLSPDLSAVRLDDRMAEGQDDAGTAEPSSAAAVDLVEAFEDALHFFGRDADPLV